MARVKTTPSYLLLAPDPARQADWLHRLRRHGAVRAFDGVESAKNEVESARRPWLSFIVDIDGDGRTIHRLLKSMRRAAPDAPGLLVMESPPRSPEAIEEVGFRFLTRDAPVAEIRYFLGYGLALEVTRDPHIAAAVEQMGRQMALTVKQMELTALAATPLARDTLVEGLGVSHNTVKTRIRQLLRIHQEETMDTLGKAVLRGALAHATGASPVNVDVGTGAMPADRKALPRPKPSPRKTKKATRAKGGVAKSPARAKKSARKAARRPARRTR
jgi:DNA-binding NarL/FixJ family response regulator